MLTNYTKTIVAIVAAALGVLVAATGDNIITPTEGINVAIAVVTAVGVYVLPNLTGGPAAYTKAAVAFLGTGLTALVAFLSDGAVDASEWLQVALAALGAIGIYALPNETKPAVTGEHVL